LGQLERAMSRGTAIVPRVSDALSLDSGDPFVVLFGPGATDSFVASDYDDVALDEALWRGLRAAGYQIVVFTSTTSPWYCLDGESSEFFSRQLGNSRDPDHASSGKRSRMSDIVLPIPSGKGFRDREPVGDESGDGEKGPVIPGDGEADGGRGEQVIDNRSFALLNACLSIRDTPIALVIIRAGDYLRFSAADRDLADWLAQWQQAPSSAASVCALVFTEPSTDAAARYLNSLGYANALLSCLERQRSRSVGQGSGEITGPDQAEIKRLIHRVRVVDKLRIADWNEIDRIVGALAAQPDVPGRNWTRRLRKLASDGVPLSLAEIREQGWVESLPSGQSAWQRLTQLTGLGEVKEHVERIRWRAEVEVKRRAAGRSRQPVSLHLMFTGGPGTGKTTVARLIGELYREMGLLRRGHLHAPEASDLIGKYVGHTAVQTSAAIDAALDGVLFIDEAYRLSEAAGGFGQEAIDTLITRMDNERDRLVVIVAGYPDKMSGFLRSNPGLPRRFPRGNIIPFPDYEPEALFTILLGMLRDRDLTWVAELEPVLHTVVGGLHTARDETFGNAGEMRNLAQEIETNWARRVRADITQPVTPDDLPAAYGRFT
jgi:hypothetical protein